MHLHLYVYIHIYTCIHTYTIYVHTHIYIYIRVYDISISISVCIYIYSHIYTYKYIYICKCLYTYVYMYIHICESSEYMLWYTLSLALMHCSVVSMQRGVSRCLLTPLQLTHVHATCIVMCMQGARKPACTTVAQARLPSSSRIGRREGALVLIPALAAVVELVRQLPRRHRIRTE